MSTRPVLLVTVAVEHRGRDLPRLQALCESHGIHPTYLVSLTATGEPAFQQFACEVTRQRKAEIGALGNGGGLGELTDRLALITGSRPTSHRTLGVLSPRLAHQLIAAGYTVDCSVTPGIGVYEGFPQRDYLLDPDDPRRAVNRSPLLELPVTIRRNYGWTWGGIIPGHRWLRPARGNLSLMLELLSQVRRELHSYAHLTVQPGDVLRHYQTLNRLFTAARRTFDPMTLSGFSRNYHPYQEWYDEARQCSRLNAVRISAPAGARPRATI
jgi:hypothetical protein